MDEIFESENNFTDGLLKRKLNIIVPFVVCFIIEKD